MKNLLDSAEKYKLRAHRKARSHYLAAKKAQKWHTLLGVPVVITTTIIGTTIFATLGDNPDIRIRAIAGSLSIAAAVLAALQTFFKFSELSQKHHATAADYSELYNQLVVLLASRTETEDADKKTLIKELDSIINRINQLGKEAPDESVNDLDKKTFIKELNSIISRMDQLEKEAPDVSDELYDRAVKEQKRDEEGV